MLLINQSAEKKELKKFNVWGGLLRRLSGDKKKTEIENNFNPFRSVKNQEFNLSDYSFNSNYTTKVSNLLISPIEKTQSFDNSDTSINSNFVASDSTNPTTYKSDCISVQDSEMTVEDHFNLNQLSQEIIDTNQEENVEDYKVGGYHPVSIGDVYFSKTTKYTIIRKLGWGHFSTVWLAKSNDNYVAIKFVKSNSNYSEAAKDEVDILNSLKNPLASDYLKNYRDYFKQESSFDGSKNILNLLDNFEVNGPNGLHVCMVFELLGENILNLLYKFKQKRLSLPKTIKPVTSGIPIHIVKPIVKQMLSGLDYMHHCGIIHTDLKPENILIDLSNPQSVIDGINTKSNSIPCSPIHCSKPICENELDENIGIKIADLGNATYSHKHFTNQIQTRQYRSPEIILKHKTWGASTDLWSVGCIIFELITGDYLFDPHDGKTFTKDDDHLAQIIELLGEYPQDDYLLNCKSTPKFFKFDCHSNMVLKNIDNLKFWSLEDVLIEKYKFEPNLELHLLTDLIKKCLKYNLNERFSAKSLLSHPWFNYDGSQTEEEITLQLEMMKNDTADIPGNVSTWE